MFVGMSISPRARRWRGLYLKGQVLALASCIETTVKQVLGAGMLRNMLSKWGKSRTWSRIKAAVPGTERYMLDERFRKPIYTLICRAQPGVALDLSEDAERLVKIDED